MCSPPLSISTDTVTTTPNRHYVLRTYGTRKNSFLLFIRDLAEKECKMFPMIFYEGKFVGGYSEACDYIDKLLTSFDENTDF